MVPYCVCNKLVLGAEEMAERKEARGRRKEDAPEGGRDASKEEEIAFDEIVMHVSR